MQDTALVSRRMPEDGFWHIDLTLFFVLQALLISYNCQGPTTMVLIASIRSYL